MYDVSNVLNTALALFVSALAAFFVLAKCLFLARWRIGWLMMAANAVYELLTKRFSWSRVQIDAALFATLPLLAWSVAGSSSAVGLTLLLGGAWVMALITDLRCRCGDLARQYGPSRGRVPLPIPRLIVLIRGPILRRRRSGYGLGVWPEGLEQDFEVIVSNPSLIRPQLPLSIAVEVLSDRVVLTQADTGEKQCPEPGDFLSMRFTLRAAGPGKKAKVRVRVVHGDFSFERTLVVQEVVSGAAARARAAVIRRWKYGAEAAFNWRGDHDLYDPATFQSADGLRCAFGLGARFQLPSTLMLSGRLSLVPEEHSRFCRRFGWNRRSEEVPDFIRFLKEEVAIAPEIDWPYRSSRQYAAEIGNHMYLHYGTHAAADEGNDWKSHARIGEGRYPWLSVYPADSFIEQRDNLRQNAHVFEKVLGIPSHSFTIPSDVYDDETARAAEAAGIEVGSETNSTKFTKVFRLPAPHHPPGCKTLVELTRKYPKDPSDAYQLAVLKYWLGAAIRTRRVLVFLAHHHLLRYVDVACYHLTEELFRHVLADCEGAVYPATLTAIGRYWRDVLSERTRCIVLKSGEREVTIENTGARELEQLPLEVTLAGGGSFLRCVNVPARAGIVFRW